MINVFASLSFLVFFVYIFLGGYVLSVEPRSNLNRVFFLLSAAFALWALTFTFFYIAPDKQSAWFWYNLSALGRIVYPAILLHLVLLFTKKDFITKNWYNSIFLYLPALLFVIASLRGPFITQDLVQINSLWYESLITTGWWWISYNLYYLIYDAGALIIIALWGYNSQILRERRQARIIVFTGALALFLGVMVNLVFQVFSVYFLPSSAQLFGVILFLGIGYAIAKYQLLKLTPAIAAEQIVSKISDLVILMDPEGIIIQINRTGKKLLGYNDAEINGKSWNFIVKNSEDEEKIRSRIQNVLKDSKKYKKSYWASQNLDISYTSKKGDSIPIKSFCSVIKDKKGVVGIVIVGKDMRQTRELQQEIVKRVKAQKSADNQANKLEILNRIIMAVNNANDLSSLQEAILNSTLMISNFKSGGIYLVDNDKEQAILNYDINLTPQFIKKFKMIDVRESPYQELIKGLRSVSGTYSQFYPTSNNNYGFLSAGFIPLVAKDELIGFITIFSNDRQKITDSQMEILDSMGREVGAGINRIKTEDQIIKSLREKEVLLKEIHHRVKNNMQIISSLLNLQSGYVRDKGAAEVLKECQGRIMSMAMIHEKLYQSGSLAGINFEEYLSFLVDDLFHTYGVDRQRVEVKIEVGQVMLDIDTAIPCGLIINELVTNSLKHAFPQGRVGNIVVRMEQDPEGTYIIEVSDNGLGLPMDLDVENSTTLGLLLVKTLVGQLEGKLDILNGNGACFKITFRESEHEKRI